MTITPNTPKKKLVSKKNTPPKSDFLQTIGKFITRQLLKIFYFLQTRKAAILVGLFCYLFAILLILALISFFFSWGSDQSEFRNGIINSLNNNEINNKNWIGGLGNFLSYTFFYRLFGVASFLLVLPLILTGNKLLFNLEKMPLLKVYKQTFIVLVLSATIFGFLSLNIPSGFPLGGAFGTYMCGKLIAFAGFLGACLILIFTLMLTLFLVFDFSIDTKFLLKYDWGAKLHALLPNQLKTDIVKQAVSKTEQTQTNTINPLEQTKPASNLPVKIKTETKPTYIDEDLNELEQNVYLEQGKQLEMEFDKTPKVKSGFASNPQNGLLLDIITPSQEEKFMEEEQERLKERERKQLESKLVTNTPLDPDDEYDPTLELSDYRKPLLEFLDLYGQDLYEEDRIEIDRDELERNKDQIIETLKNYNIEIAKITATPGPTVTLYEIVPAPGVRISKIRNLEDDIALSLSALGIRIIAPMPGKGTVGVEVPNQRKETVSLRSLLAHDRFQRAKMDLPVALGKTISNENYIADLSKMPHLLLAGSTGQGKSVCLNSILISLLYKKHPAELKFVMIDPKKVELSLYNIIERHFLAKLPDLEEAIVTDTKHVITTLGALCFEMDLRYDLLKNAGVRNLKEYNIKFKQRRLNPKNGHRFLPYIVLVIDEFADLIMTAGKEVEMPLARLAQLSRAVGIHIVIATQRPTVNIITGTIKANFPVRIAFRVTAKVDSRTILDTGGAEQLVGKGDLLISIGGELIRLQGAFCDTHEVERICDYIGSQKGYDDPMFLPEFIDEGSTTVSNDNFETDDMFEEAARIIVQHQQGSTSLIQRKLKLGYNRAGRLMDQLEKAGIVGASNGSKAREVYVVDEFHLDEYLKRFKDKTNKVF